MNADIDDDQPLDPSACVSSIINVRERIPFPLSTSLYEAESYFSLHICKSCFENANREGRRRQFFPRLLKPRIPHLGLGHKSADIGREMNF